EPVGATEPPGSAGGQLADPLVAHRAALVLLGALALNDLDEHGVLRPAPSAEVVAPDARSALRRGLWPVRSGLDRSDLGLPPCPPNRCRTRSTACAGCCSTRAGWCVRSAPVAVAGPSRGGAGRSCATSTS